MVMRDPRPVNTGLSLRLKTASLTPPWIDQPGWDWKQAHDTEVHGMLNEEILLDCGSIYDQSKRFSYAKPTSLCRLAWSSFLASEELLLKSNPVAAQALNDLVRGVRTKLYAMVETHGIPELQQAPWEAAAPVPSIFIPPVDIVTPSAERRFIMPPVSLVEGGDEEPVNSAATDDEEDDADDSPPPVMSAEPVQKRVKPEISESL